MVELAHKSDQRMSTQYVGVTSQGFVFGVNLMVKLLRACVWMPWRDQAMKDAASGDTPRGEASIL